MTARSLLVAISMVLTAAPVAATELFRCRILDAVEAGGGKWVRTKQAARDLGFFNPIIIDIETAKMRVGRFQTEYGNFSVLQRPQPRGFDFVAAEPLSRDTIRLRTWEQPIQTSLSHGGFQFLTGVCDLTR